jgi:hypothetical protein
VEKLEAPTNQGLLSNDLYGPLLYVEDDISKDSGFEGSVEVQKDGKFEYETVPGKLGVFTFTYKYKV